MACLRLSSLLVTALVFSAALQPARSVAIPGFQECELFGRRYDIGEGFHPILDINGMEYEAICYNCTCLPSTIAQCQEIHCPSTNCLTPIVVSGECCPICLEADITPQGPRTCFYDGVEFDDGDEFHPPSMMDAQRINESATNPFCTKCTCNEGTVTCEDITSSCPPLACNETEAFLIHSSCCKMCPTGPPPEPQPGCRDAIDGRFHPEGSFWNPFYPGFGYVECINCTCNDSEVVCRREPCQPVRVCGPDDPVEDVVICCPRCQRIAPTTFPPTTVQPTNSSSNSSSNTTDPTTEQEEGEEGEEEEEEENSDGMELVPILTPCNVVFTFKVFRHQMYDTMALVNTLTDRAEVYSWVLLGGQVVREYEESSADAFYARADSSQFAFVGYTSPRRVNGLTTRESKRQRIERCMMNCATLVVNMLRPQTTLPTCEESS